MEKNSCIVRIVGLSKDTFIKRVHKLPSKSTPSTSIFSKTLLLYLNPKKAMFSKNTIEICENCLEKNSKQLIFSQTNSIRIHEKIFSFINKYQFNEYYQICNHLNYLKRYKCKIVV